MKYNEWKGNIRELKNTIEMMVVVSPHRELEYLEDEGIGEGYSVQEEDIGELTLKEYISNVEKDFLIKCKKQVRNYKKHGRAS